MPQNRKEKEKTMAKNMTWYINHNDFEGAKERFDTTTPNWKKRWFEACYQIYQSSKEWATKYILNPIEFTISKINMAPTTRKTAVAYNIQMSEECPSLLDDATQKCYLFSFFDSNDNLVCSKVGTTIRKVRQRLREELNSKTYQNMGCVRAVIQRVYDCGNTPAEGLESRIRAEYIKKYPNSFLKNDRFINTFFDLAEIDKIAAEYCA